MATAGQIVKADTHRRNKPAVDKWGDHLLFNPKLRDDFQKRMDQLARWYVMNWCKANKLGRDAYHNMIDELGLCRIHWRLKTFKKTRKKATAV